MTFAHAEMLGDALLALGRSDAARAQYAAEPLDWAKTTGQAHSPGARGSPRRALRWRAWSPAQGDAAYQQAEILAQLGDVGPAVDALYRARAVGDQGLVTIQIDPWRDPLRRDPRVRALISQLGAS